ncbi:hypothetical protein [Paenibacillus eucommiae]|uniref:Uncharacterized protein n=1 Tax=Paenibacillus eucommiae TaxID=1355755 RepID=A0ABS4IU53_9BACL|nr:hypothetical protein [Paenibacillus eucommiae]MBP1991100.1 hypothetical protein [Paenibacillus eucommiae]
MKNIVKVAVPSQLRALFIPSACVSWEISSNQEKNPSLAVRLSLVFV